MFAVIGGMLLFVGLILVWFHIPYSPVKSDFQKDAGTLISENQVRTDNGVFAKKDFRDLPVAIQKYIEGCGYLGTPKMSYLKMEYHNVDFAQGKNGPTLKIDYTQYNFINEPCRLALIDSSMFGIPFEEYDSYQNGIGGMKGVIAKAITLFAPTILLQDYIVFEEISTHKIRATITYGGQAASGIFTFNEQYEMISFTTNDRAVAGTDGSMEYIPWSAICNDYQLASNGIKYPTKFQAVWNYQDGDFVYFDGVISEVSYGYEQ